MHCMVAVSLKMSFYFLVCMISCLREMMFWQNANEYERHFQQEGGARHFLAALAIKKIEYRQDSRQFQILRGRNI